MVQLDAGRSFGQIAHQKNKVRFGKNSCFISLLDL
jgi:hypothetical protein